MSVRVIWTKGGEAWVQSLQGDAIALRSTLSSPPGSRLLGALPSSAEVQVKIHGCKREPEVAGEAPVFVLQGRVLNATRALREELASSPSAALE